MASEKVNEVKKWDINNFVKTSEEPPAKKPKIETRMWTSEGRMFQEKVFYLNKSTTKYAIVGVHPTELRPKMKICDRASGAHILINMFEFVYFIRHIKCAMNPDPEDDGTDDTGESGVSIQPVSKNVWKITTNSNGFGLAMHRISLEKLLEIEGWIFNEMKERLRGDDYADALEAIRKATTGFNEGQILDFLNGVKLKGIRESMKSILPRQDNYELCYDIACDLMCNREYFLTLAEYDEGFFRRILF